jgi:2Fe-2S ferredoxin
LVLVEPSGISFEVGPGETVFAAASRQGYRWPTVCGGLGTCRTCIMTVLEGEANCSVVGSWEAEGLAEVGASVRAGSAPVRLACQTEVSGTVRVRKAGVRAAHTN